MKLENIAAKFLILRVLKKILTLLGCILFVFSIIYPFYYEGLLIGTEIPVYHWSYKVEYPSYIANPQQIWFIKYWFPQGIIDLSWILISMFAIQVLTLVFGIASLIFSRRTLFIATILLSLTVMLLMISAREVLSGYHEGARERFLEGFYVIFPSIISFLFAFILHRIGTKRTASIQDKAAHVDASTHHIEGLLSCC